MKILITDDDGNELASFPPWKGSTRIIPQVIHILFVALRDGPEKAFDKAVGHLPKVNEPPKQGSLALGHMR